ncbi:TetR/AcrR family transcriptional regulator [Williamsia sp. CHRR-6]|uniref:TetR/AcrR family transcriptional regulator n=1 Tax=Williamsia sp. CHRR-6 TaxID=2835871 RepID=UPI0027DDC82A|nr:TetR/AcrR family transcriptional regulator [Williamsia sp. CHRR-6]
MSTADQTAAKPLRADAERNRLRIIDAARDLFAERGLDVTLDDVAGHAGVGVGTVYRRFDNRDHLIEGVFLEHLRNVNARVEAALATEDPWQGIVEVFTFVGESVATDRGLAAIVMRVDPTAPAIEAAKSEMTGRVEQMYVRGIEAGVLRPGIDRTDLFAFFTMLTAVADATQAVAPGTWRRYLELILDSIRANGRHPLTTPPMSEEQVLAAQVERVGGHRRTTC